MPQIMEIFDVINVTLASETSKLPRNMVAVGVGIQIHGLDAHDPSTLIVVSATLSMMTREGKSLPTTSRQN
jgi:hypothetical protein